MVKYISRNGGLLTSAEHMYVCVYAYKPIQLRNSIHERAFKCIVNFSYINSLIMFIFCSFAFTMQVLSKQNVINNNHILPSHTSVQKDLHKMR